MAAGDEITAAQYALDTRRAVFRANRTSTSSASTGSEVGVLRVDDQSVEGGRIYDLRLSGLVLDSTVASDIAICRVRATTDGTTPTTSSGEIGALRDQIYAVSNEPIVTFSTLYVPGSSDVVLSLLLTVQRVAGTGSVTIVPATGGIHMWLVDLGPDTGDVGVDV